MTGKIVIKRMFSELLSLCGVHSLMEHFCFSHKAFILMYHRVLASGGNQPYFVQSGMYVSASSFEKQIAFLRDRFEVVFFEDLVEKVLNGGDISGHCAITFDDGWLDNYTDAFPLLKKYRVPATIFLATGFVDRGKIFWPEEICCYLDRSMGDMLTFDSAPPSYVRFSEEISRYSQGIRETFFNRSIEILKRYSPGEREEILGYLRDMFKTDPMLRQILSWDEAREMLSSGLVRFGAHTVNHEILDQVPLQKVRDEISASREAIERRLGGKVRSFAYPNGNHNNSIRMVLKESGFDAAVTTRKGYLSTGTPLMEVPRIAIHEDVSNSIPMFRSRILFRTF